MPSEQAVMYQLIAQEIKETKGATFKDGRKVCELRVGMNHARACHPERLFIKAKLFTNNTQQKGH